MSTPSAVLVVLVKVFWVTKFCVALGASAVMHCLKVLYTVVLPFASFSTPFNRTRPD